MKLLIADDEKELVNALVAILKHSNYTVDAVYDGTDALDYALAGDYDGIILDIMMPGMDGTEVLKKIREKGLSTPVLFLTAKTEVEDRIKGLDLGADDYLPKPFAMKELMARVRAMTRRKREYDSGIMTFGDISLNGETFELRCINSVRLSVKEFELLQLLIKNSSHPVSADHMIHTVWDNSPDASEGTVRLYIRYLNDKLKAISSKTGITDSDAGYRIITGT